MQKRANTQKDRSVPDYAHTVVVPIANPETAPRLLQIAYAVVRADGGTIHPLVVILGDADAEANLRKVSKLEEIVGEFKEQDDDDNIKIDLMTRSAPNIARGILDSAREKGAELIVLGLKEPVSGQVELGQVAESVIETAPCDVLIYRNAVHPQFDRIVVPVDGSTTARMAVRMGIMLANGYGKPIEVLHVLNRANDEADGMAKIEQSLRGVHGAGICKKRVVYGYDVASGVLSRVNEDDMLIVGFSGGGELGHWLVRSRSRRLLERAAGPVLLTARRPQQAAPTRAVRRAVGWLRPALTDVEQEQIMWYAQEAASPTLDYAVLITVSAFLAAFGLLQNSAAVVIGAMLVAPLLGPITAFAIGLCTARLRLARRALGTVLLGVALATLVGIATGLVLPLENPTTEMLARSRPTLLDAGVAIAAGIVGAYATARKDIPAALAGVAIAAALVPPICTFGLNLALREDQLAMGALLLVTINIVSISLVSTALFFWLGLRPNLESGMHRLQYVSWLIVALMAFPTVAFTLNFSQQARVDVALEEQLNDIEDYMRTAFDEAQFVALEAQSVEPALIVVATLRSATAIPPEAVQEAQVALIDAYDLGAGFELRVAVQQLVIAPTALPTVAMFTPTPTSQPQPTATE